MRQPRAAKLIRSSQLIALAAIIAVIGVLICSLDYNTRWFGSDGSLGVDGF